MSYPKRPAAEAGVLPKDPLDAATPPTPVEHHGMGERVRRWLRGAPGWTLLALLAVARVVNWSTGESDPDHRGAPWPQLLLLFIGVTVIVAWVNVRRHGEPAPRATRARVTVARRLAALPDTGVFHCRRIGTHGPLIDHLVVRGAHVWCIADCPHQRRPLTRATTTHTEEHRDAIIRAQTAADALRPHLDVPVHAWVVCANHGTDLPHIPVTVTSLPDLVTTLTHHSAATTTTTDRDIVTTLAALPTWQD